MAERDDAPLEGRVFAEFRPRRLGRSSLNLASGELAAVFGKLIGHDAIHKKKPPARGKARESPGNRGQGRGAPFPQPGASSVAKVG